MKNSSPDSAANMKKPAALPVERRGSGTAAASARGGDVTEVVYRLEPPPGGTPFTYEHTGFTGVGGMFMAKLLGRVHRKMLSLGLPPGLANLDDRAPLPPPTPPPPQPPPPPQ